MDNVESISRKLLQIQELTKECLGEISKSGLSKKTTAKTSNGNSLSGVEKEIDILQIVNKIKKCPEADIIDKKILAKSSARNRILLPLYICHRNFPGRRLSTGEIETITSELSVKVSQSNVAKRVAGPLMKYLDADSTRKKGKSTLYKLNRKGKEFFESLLNE